MARTYELAVKPWESSSEVFTKGARALGLSEDFHFEEVLGLEGPLPGGTIALVLTYITPADYETQKSKSEDLLKTTAAASEQDSTVVWLPQKVQNACGPHSLFHAVFNSNCRHHLGKPVPRTMFSYLSNDKNEVKRSPLYQLQQRLMEASSCEERVVALGDFSELWEMCSSIGEMGFTSPPENAEEDVDPHFVCFAGMSGNLAVFDGDRTSGPKDLNIRLDSGGLVPDQALYAVRRHLTEHADEERRDFASLLALVNTIF
jgi:ubiquitin carboxyl-terminal hydrolase L3